MVRNACRKNSKLVQSSFCTTNVKNSDAIKSVLSKRFLLSTSKLRKTIKIKNKDFVALVDSGSEFTLMREDVFHKKLNLAIKTNLIDLIGFGNMKSKAKCEAELTMEIDNVKLTEKCILVDEMGYADWRKFYILSGCYFQ